MFGVHAIRARFAKRPQPPVETLYSCDAMPCGCTVLVSFVRTGDVVRVVGDYRMKCLDHWEAEFRD
jgi:hypothetical protein